MVKQEFLDLSGGQVNSVAPLFMKKNECEIIQNYHLDNVGSLTKRNGTLILIGAPGTLGSGGILSIFYFKNANGTDNSNVLLAANNNNGSPTVSIFTIQTNAWSASNYAGTASAIPYFCTFIDYIFSTNGSDVMATAADPTTWGTTNALATKKYKFCCVWQDRVYVLNDNSATAYPSRIQWSSLPSGTPLAVTWGASDYADINPDDNDELTWGEPFGSVLLIFKTEGLYRWTFGQVEPDKMPGVQGTPQGLTVKQSNGICFWANKYGVWALTNPYGIPTLISKKVQPFIDQISSLTAMRAEVDQDHYRLSIGDVTVDNIAYSRCFLVYTISKKTWHIETFSGTAIQTMARFRRKTLGSTEIYDEIYMGNAGGIVVRMNTGTSDHISSNSTHLPISGKIMTKEYPLPHFPEDDDLVKMWVIAQQAIGTNIKYRLNRRDWKPWKDLKERITEGIISGKDKTIQLSITDNSIVTSKIEGFVIETKRKDGEK